MTRTGNRALMIALSLATIVLVLAALGVAKWVPSTSPTVRDAAATLAIISGAAIAIERVIETGWTVVGMTVRGGIWWPFNQVGRQVERLEAVLNAALEPVYADARKAATVLHGAGSAAEQAAHVEIGTLQQGVADMMRLAPSSQRLELIAGAANQAVSFLQQKYTTIQATASIANEAIDGLSSFISSFTDNPGRRLISLYLGVALGLATTSVLGLDVFAAVFGQSGTSSAGGAAFLANSARAPTGADPGFFPHGGVAITGVVIGLGSSPTHEVIRVLQEIKKSRKASNRSSGNGDGTAADGGGTSPDGSDENG